MHRFAVPILAELELDVSHLERAGSLHLGCIFMASVGLNKWIVSGNLGADAQIKTIDLRNGEKAQVAEATLYVRSPRNRDESFRASL